MDQIPNYGITFDGPARYRILVKGRIPDSWSDRIDGMSICQEAPDDQVPVTSLEGELADQAALTGVINTLYELHLPIISVKSVASSKTAESETNETVKD
jgi:hypothetical protein